VFVGCAGEKGIRGLLEGWEVSGGLLTADGRVLVDGKRL